MTIALRLAVALAVGVLAGCGFHLQGSAPLPAAFHTTRIVASDRYTDFHRALVESLEAAGASVLEGSGSGPVVEVLEDQPTQRVLSVSASNTPTEYEVYYAIRYRVTLEGREVIAPSRLELLRDYSFDTTAILAKEQEQATIRLALARELAGLVMRRLAAIQQ
ncbi:MAG: LPS assembly lipoprotein LptE [Pseudomonadota bacterium]|jgi:LPS-assembly lipoprotein